MIRPLGRRDFSNILTYTILIVLALFALSPILWVLSTSLKPRSETLRFPPSLIPESVSSENYVFVLTDPFLLRSLLNSIVVSFGAAALCVSISALAGYSLARFRFKGRETIMSVVLGLFMIPVVMNIIPLYIMLRDMGLLDNYLGLILTYQTLIIPLNIFLLKNYFETIPIELEEAAMVDGTTRLGAFLRVTAPLSWPGLAVAAILSFRFAWNEFVLPVTFISDPQMNVFQVAVFRFISIHEVEWGYLTAGIMVGMLPVLLMLTIFQRQMIKGITLGSTK